MDPKAILNQTGIEYADNQTMIEANTDQQKAEAEAEAAAAAKAAAAAAAAAESGAAAEAAEAEAAEKAKNYLNKCRVPGSGEGNPRINILPPGLQDDQDNVIFKKEWRKAVDATLEKDEDLRDKDFSKVTDSFKIKDVCDKILKNYTHGGPASLTKYRSGQGGSKRKGRKRTKRKGRKRTKRRK